MKNNKVVILAITVLGLIAAFAAATHFYRADQTQKMKFLADKNFEHFVRDYSPRMGAEKPKVYLVEFLDPECEACRMIAPYVKDLMKDYKDRVQLVIRYAPFHSNSQFAVKILEAARKQGKYWETLDLIFEKQPQWGDHHNPQPDLIWTFLPQIKDLDVEQIKKDMNDPLILSIIEKDMEDLHFLGVRRTPSFFANGKPLQKFGPQPLRDLIEQELKN